MTYNVNAKIYEVLEGLPQAEYDRIDNLIMTVWEYAECEELVNFCQKYDLTFEMLENYAIANDE